MPYARAMVLRNPTVTVESVDYDDQISKARLVPDTPIQTMRTFGGVDQDRDQTAWTLELAGHQDRGASGFADAIDDAVASGVASLTVVIQAKAGAGQDVATVEIVPIPVEFGGEAGSWKSFEQTFAVIGQPTFTQSA